MTNNNTQKIVGHLYDGDREISADADLINNKMMDICNAICDLDTYFNMYSFDGELFSAIADLREAYMGVEKKMKELIDQKYWYNP